ncbi:transposable element Tc3 transposase, partial [Choiromyces venosus 120613-1]
VDCPPHSPDLNSIENVWGIFKRRYRKAVWKRKRIPHNREELIGFAQEVWRELPWEGIYGWLDRIPERVNFCLRRNGGA